MQLPRKRGNMIVFKITILLSVCFYFNDSFTINSMCDYISSITNILVSLKRYIYIQNIVESSYD